MNVPGIVVGGQLFICVLIFFLFIKQSKMAPKRALIAGVLAFSFMPIAAVFLFGKDMTFATIPLGFLVIVGAFVAIFPPPGFKIFEGETVLTAVACGYVMSKSIFVDKHVWAWIPYILICLYVVIEIFREEQMTQMQRANLYFIHCLLMCYVFKAQLTGLFSLNKHDVFNEMSDFPHWFIISFFIQYSLVWNVSRIVTLYNMFPRKNERNYGHRLKTETIPQMARLMSSYNVSPFAVLITGSCFILLCVANEQTGYMDYQLAIAPALAIAPFSYKFLRFFTSRRSV